MSTSFEPGAAPRGFIPLCVPSIGGNAWAYVKECLDTNWVSSVGPFVDRLEQMMTAYTGGRYAVATVNGTAALHVALLVAGVKPDEEVLVSTLTFIASANAVRYAGAWPVFIDAEPDYWQMDPERVGDFLEKQCTWQEGRLLNKATGRRVSAIVPVHVLGHPVPLTPILELARKYNLCVIEDAAEALGARYEDRRIGQWGDITCFSYNGNKIITTGGGGMLVTNNAEYAAKARYLTTQAKDDPLEYIHKETGFNYRLTNLQAALGCAQMELLDLFVAAKRTIAARYRAAFVGCPGLTMMREAPWAFSTYWLFTLLVNEQELGISSREVLRRLADKQIQSRPLWQPMHRSPSFAALPGVECPVADALCRDAISLPCSVGLSAEDQHQVIEAISQVICRSRQAA